MRRCDGPDTDDVGAMTTYRESICVRAQAHDVSIAIGSIAFGAWLHQAIVFGFRIFRAKQIGQFFEYTQVQYIKRGRIYI